MKAFMKATLATLTVCALVSISAFAGDKDKTETKTLTVAQDIMVNGTLVKAGEYQIKFDEKTGELSILRDGKVKAKTAAHLEARNDKAKETALRTIDKAGVTELAGVSFRGWTQDVVVGTSGIQSTSPFKYMLSAVADDSTGIASMMFDFTLSAFQ